LINKEITRAELDHVVERIGEFDGDNRAGLERTLHRISCLRNRRGHIAAATSPVSRVEAGRYGRYDPGYVESSRSLVLSIR